MEIKQVVEKCAQYDIHIINQAIMCVFVYNLIGKGKDLKNVHWDFNPDFLGGGVGMAKEKWKELSLKKKKKKTETEMYDFEKKMILKECKYFCKIILW